MRTAEKKVCTLNCGVSTAEDFWTQESQILIDLAAVHSFKKSSSEKALVIVRIDIF